MARFPAFSLSVLFLLLLCHSASAAAGISWGKYELKLSEVAPGNVLPAFEFLASQVEGGAISVPIGGGTVQASPFVPGDSAPFEIWDHASADLHAPFLPYLLQDQWDCARTPTNVSALIFEDERLRLTIMPQWNARIWSVYDKTLKRNWVFDNPAHQPANVAVLKAWTSGGIEFNWSPGKIGHSAFSESPSWVGVVRTPRGPVVRAWEYDRRNASVWSVDIFLEGGALFVHPRVTNTRAAPIQGYWWTCVADRAFPTTRIITPAEHTVDTSSGTQWAPWPFFAMGDPNATFSGYKGRRLTDNSFMGAVTSGDFFMGPTDPDQHYIAYADATGFVGYHGHDEKINGTKFFTWGQNGAGRFMQDFLGGISGPGPIPDGARVGDYTELQVGPAFTQMQTFDVATQFSWSEYFSGFVGDPAVLLGDSYRGAVDAVNSWRSGPTSGVNDTRLADVTAFLDALEDAPVDEVLSVGSPWGAVELARRVAPGGAAGAAPWPRGYVFNASRDLVEAAPWLELVEGGAVGTFSPATLAAEPVSWQVSPEWLAVLRESAAAHGATWLHDLFIAVALAEMGGVDEPRALPCGTAGRRRHRARPLCHCVGPCAARGRRPLPRAPPHQPRLGGGGL
jgi:hypothetical protein